MTVSEKMGSIAFYAQKAQGSQEYQKKALQDSSWADV